MNDTNITITILEAEEVSITMSNNQQQDHTGKTTWELDGQEHPQEYTEGIPKGYIT